jgi:tRNA U34 2-thiouridine synthase MnmA/TrmU
LQYIERNSGEIRDIETDELMGMHNGVQHYTMGKRIAVDADKQSPAGLFVAALDAPSRTVYTVSFYLSSIDNQNHFSPVVFICY